MSEFDELQFFQLRKMGKTYISKLFTYGAQDLEKKRNVKMVLEGSDVLHLGEIDGALCLRLTGDTRKTQVTAVVTQDDKKVKRLSFQTFKPRAGEWIGTSDKEDFTFRGEEFQKLLEFLKRIDFIDFSDTSRFDIEDLSVGIGPKKIVDAADMQILASVKGMSAEQRRQFLGSLQSTLSAEEVNILLGRKQGLEIFERQMELLDWNEGQWQEFFEAHKWVFGYGLNYRVLRHFLREATVGGGGTDNRNKPKIDFLMKYKDFTALVEIKLPSTRIFRNRQAGRAGTWDFTPEFIGAISQALEQRAEWQANAAAGDNYNKAGEELKARTKNPKTVLIIGSHSEFEKAEDARSSNLMKDTFELFRRECSGIDILTYDELLERAKFITTNV